MALAPGCRRRGQVPTTTIDTINTVLFLETGKGSDQTLRVKELNHRPHSTISDNTRGYYCMYLMLSLSSPPLQCGILPFVLPPTPPPQAPPEVLWRAITYRYGCYRRRVVAPPPRATSPSLHLLAPLIPPCKVLFCVLSVSFSSFLSGFCLNSIMLAEATYHRFVFQEDFPFFYFMKFSSNKSPEKKDPKIAFRLLFSGTGVSTSSPAFVYNKITKIFQHKKLTIIRGLIDGQASTTYSK